MFNVYHFDHQSKAFTGPGLADPNPRAPAEPLIPFSATTIAPPAFLQGAQMAFFRGEGWTVEDLPPPPPAPGQPPAEEPAPLTFEQRSKALQDAVQAQLDAIARAHGYDSIASAVSYAEEPAVPRFQREGQALRAWRSLVWAACYALLAEVQAGERSEPSWDELLAELPAFVAPEAAE